MDGQGEKVLLIADMDEAGEKDRTACQVDAHMAVLADDLFGPPLPGLFGQRAKIRNGKLVARLLRDDLEEFTVHHAKGGAQRFMAMGKFADGLLRHGIVHLAFQTESDGHVGRGRFAVDLVQDPIAVLFKAGWKDKDFVGLRGLTDGEIPGVLDTNVDFLQDLVLVGRSCRSHAASAYSNYWSDVNF